MAKALKCDRCGTVVTRCGDMNEIKISPYVGITALSGSGIKCRDLCKDCTETLMQYINNEVEMIIFKDSEAAGDLMSGNDTDHQSDIEKVI